MNIARAHNTNLSQADFSLVIHEDQGGHAAHPKPGCSLPPHLAHHIEPEHRGFPVQLSLQPIYDGFRQQARASKVGVEFDHRRATGAQESIELVQ